MTARRTKSKTPQRVDGSETRARIVAGRKPDAAGRRWQIKQAARKVFGELGYHNARVVDIIAAADVSRRTFYSYFDGKEALIEAIFDDFDVLLKELRRLEFPADVDTPADLRARLQRSALLLVPFALENGDIARLVFEGLAQEQGALTRVSQRFLDELETYTRQYLEAAMSKGLIRSVSPRIASSLVTGMFLETGRKVLLLGDDVSIQEWSDEIVALLDHGFLADHG
jgi:AcrR family transcriptional regulator